MFKKISMFQSKCLRHFIITATLAVLILILSLTQIFAQEMHASNTSPAYPGGKNAIKELINKNLRFPDNARKAGISGVVEVNFTVSKEGNVEDIKIMKGIGFGCDEEAIRLTGLLSRWSPGIRQGNPVSTTIDMPVEFKGENKLIPSVITGRVTEKCSGIPAEGVLVIIKGTNIGSVTGADGSYRLSIPSENKSLECFGVGYALKEVSIDNHSIINIELDKESMIIDFSSQGN